MTPATLVGVNVFIIADPDTPAETDHPQYIMPDEIAAIEQWVRDGGRLVLLGNDNGNAEFEHFNQLARRFGIEFLEETYPHVKSKGILVAAGDTLIFQGASEVYLVEIAPLKLAPGVPVLLADQGTPVMALAHAGLRPLQRSQSGFHGHGLARPDAERTFLSYANEPRHPPNQAARYLAASGNAVFSSSKYP